MAPNGLGSDVFGCDERLGAWDEPPFGSSRRLIQRPDSLDSAEMLPLGSDIRLPRRALFLMATAFGVSSTVQSALLMRINGEQCLPGDWIQLPVLNLAYWYIPALLAPVIMGLAVRYQLGRTSWWTQLAVHGTGAVGYSVLHTGTMFALRAALA